MKDTNPKDRITNLDFIHGIAVLGILVLNVVVFVLPMSAYYNPSSAGTGKILDWIVVALSQILVAEKMMGLFSLLFGASIVFPELTISRSGLMLYIVAILVLQIYWSKYWLDHFQYGPFEWVWRKCTYITIKAPITLEKKQNP